MCGLLCGSLLVELSSWLVQQLGTESLLQELTGLPAGAAGEALGFDLGLTLIRERKFREYFRTAKMGKMTVARCGTSSSPKA